MVLASVAELGEFLHYASDVESCDGMRWGWFRLMGLKMGKWDY